MIKSAIKSNSWKKREIEEKCYTKSNRMKSRVLAKFILLVLLLSYLSEFDSLIVSFF